MVPDLGLERWLGWRQVHDLTGLGRTTAWRMRQDGDFPDPVPISPGRVAWRARDIAAWTATRGETLPPRPPRKPRCAPEPTPAPSDHHAPTAPVAPSPPTPPAHQLSAARPQRHRRTRPAIAEGQLGFDF